MTEPALLPLRGWTGLPGGDLPGLLDAAAARPVRGIPVGGVRVAPDFALLRFEAPDQPVALPPEVGTVPAVEAAEGAPARHRVHGDRPEFEAAGPVRALGVRPRGTEPWTGAVFERVRSVLSRFGSSVTPEDVR